MIGESSGNDLGQSRRDRNIVPQLSWKDSASASARILAENLQSTVHIPGPVRRRCSQPVTSQYGETGEVLLCLQTFSRDEADV
jgi:hypothetical protein